MQTREYDLTCEPQTSEALQNCLYLDLSLRDLPILRTHFIYEKKTNVLEAALFTWCFLISFCYFHGFSSNEVAVNLDPTVALVWNKNIVEKPL